jgi:TatA/E family protein of Tat protein translocase
LELIIVLIIILILIGGTRLPKISKSVGKAIGNIKKGISEPKGTDETAKEEGSKKEEIKD